MKYNSFQTPERRLLGAGPTNLYPEISKALTKPEVGHLDPKFVEMMDEVKSMLRYLFQTKNEFTIAISAPGSSGMEASFVNLVEPGDKVKNPANKEWGVGQVQSIIDDKVTVNFENVGKKVINIKNIVLIKIYE